MRARSRHESGSFWIRTIGLVGVLGVVGLAGVLAVTPFLKVAPEEKPSDEHHIEMLAGVRYDTAVHVLTDGQFEVHLASVTSSKGDLPLPTALVRMRGGGMSSVPKVAKVGADEIVVSGTLAMRGDWELTLGSGGEFTTVALQNNWSF